MKTGIALLVAASLGFAAASVILSHRLQKQYDEQLASQQAAWQAEIEQLESELQQARRHRPAPQIVPNPAPVGEPARAPGMNTLTPPPQEILGKLLCLKIDEAAFG